jgi:hypothetical protein
MAASFLVSCSSFFTYSQAESDGQHLKLWKVHPWTVWEGARGKHIITIIRESSAAIDWTLAWSVRLSSSCCMEIFSSSRFWSCTNAAWRITLHEKPMYQSLDLSRWSCCRNFLLCFAIQHLSLLDKTPKPWGTAFYLLKILSCCDGMTICLFCETIQLLLHVCFLHLQIPNLLTSTLISESDVNSWTSIWRSKSFADVSEIDVDQQTVIAKNQTLHCPYENGKA